MPPNPLEILFLDGLTAMFYAEQRILKALPEFQAAARSADLRAAFEAHEVETHGHIQRLAQVFERLEVPPQAVACPAVDGLLLDAAQTIETYRDSPAIDAALVAAAQALGHLQIARYGALVSWADCLSLEEAADLLDLSLDAEAAADEVLSDLADTTINEAALQIG
jgi:ferritin-like metal-binding protein YciE